MAWPERYQRGSQHSHTGRMSRLEMTWQGRRKDRTDRRSHGTLRWWPLTIRRPPHRSPTHPASASPTLLCVRNSLNCTVFILANGERFCAKEFSMHYFSFNHGTNERRYNLLSSPCEMQRFCLREAESLARSPESPGSGAEQ